MQAIGGGVDCVVFTAFGGTLLRFDGNVYVDQNKAETVLVKGTSPAYCAQQENTSACDGTDLRCIEYVCYASGDCTNGGGDCPTGDALDAMGLPDLNGGWYGKVGYYFPEEASANFPTICLGKTGGVDNEVTARSYFSERTVGNQLWREGINQSHGCHKIIITESSCDAQYDKLVPGGVVWNSFVEHEVIRPLTSAEVNSVLDTDNTYCDLVAIYGEILFPDDSDIPISGNVVATSAGAFTFDPVPVTVIAGMAPWLGNA